MSHEYKMLRCRDEIYLSSEVTKHLAEGWELWGNPFMLTMDMENGWICQAVVRMAQEPAVAVQTNQTAEAAGFTTQVPETPLEEQDGPTVKVPILPEFACACFEKVGDNPQCHLHGGGPLPVGHGGLAS